MIVEKIEKLPLFLQFHGISLSLNSNKSVSISIEHDHLDQRSLLIILFHNIRSLQKDEKSYLGTDFKDKILLHTGKIAQDLKHSLDLLIGSSLLKCIYEQYLQHPRRTTKVHK